MSDDLGYRTTRDLPPISVDDLRLVLDGYDAYRDKDSGTPPRAEDDAYDRIRAAIGDYADGA